MASILETPQPPRRLVEFKRLVRFQRITRFQQVYPRFEHISEYILEQRWELMGAYVGLTLLAETMVALVNPFYGLLVHTFLLLGFLVSAGILAIRSEPMSRVATAMMILPLVRVVSLTTPLGSFSYLEWFLLTGGVLFLACLAVLRVLGTAPEDVGLRLPRLKHVPLELGVVALALPIGVAEYALLRPGPVLDNTSLTLLVGPAIILILTTGLLEELMFRGLLARYFAPVFGGIAAAALPAACQAVLDVNSLNGAHVILVFATGLVYGLVVMRTRSILGVSISHGLANVLLFLVLPVTGLGF